MATNKGFKLELSNEEQMQEFCNHVVIAKLIADELSKDSSYEAIVNLADELNISVADVQAYMKLYQYMQTQMML